jgi:small subunit ribosomal protein S1
MDQNDAQLEQGVTPENTENSADGNNMASLLENEGLSLDFPQQGETRTGVVASISPSQILVSIGTKSEGIISGKELEAIPAEELAALEVNQEIPVYILNPEDQNGNVVLSYMRAREEVSWQKAEDMLKSKLAYHSSIIGYNKGGLIVPLDGLRGFVPASQISLSRRAAMSGETPEQRWSKMVGEEIDVVVIEVDRERRRLILSERAASTETRESLKERVIDELKEGEVRNGRVTSLADFGAFVNINGADGLVHLSEISWDRIQHPSEVLKVGQEVKVKVISIDRDKKRIGLSIRQLLEDPWNQRVAKYQVGQLIEAAITRLTKFGAFARLEEDMEGLIHISEISEKRIEHPKEVLHEGDTVTLRIIKIDPENHRIGLSLRRVDSQAYADLDWQSLEEDLGIVGGSETGQIVIPDDMIEEINEASAVDTESAAEETAVAEEPTVAEEPVAAEVEVAEVEEQPQVEEPAVAETEAAEVEVSEPVAEVPAVAEETAVAEEPAAEAEVAEVEEQPQVEEAVEEQPEAEVQPEATEAEEPEAEQPASDEAPGDEPADETPVA